METKFIRLAQKDKIPLANKRLSVSAKRALSILKFIPRYYYSYTSINSILKTGLDIDELSFDDRLGLLIDNEMTERDNRRLTARLKVAQLKQ